MEYGKCIKNEGIDWVLKYEAYIFLVKLSSILILIIN